MIPKFLRFQDLKDAGVVSNRVTLQRWIDAGRFPAPVRLGENSVAWREDEVRAHLDQLSAARDGKAA